ncbi:hypothetical protein GGI07_001582 [Coemansia sp. Benny D115]|nr:hypothetical protein GGI07_001582 [Coemansia sp. Benny D115]
MYAHDVASKVAPSSRTAPSHYQTSGTRSLHPSQSPTNYPRYPEGPAHGRYTTATASTTTAYQGQQAAPMHAPYYHQTRHAMAPAHQHLAPVPSMGAYSGSTGHMHPYMHSSTMDAHSRMPLANAEERERKRRISHSAMERRRRERTNAVINELKFLVPNMRDEARTQKLEVLEQSVIYIKELHAAYGILPSSGHKRRRFQRQSFDEDEEEEETHNSQASDSSSANASPRHRASASPVQESSRPGAMASQSCVEPTTPSALPLSNARAAAAAAAATPLFSAEGCSPAPSPVHREHGFGAESPGAKTDRWCASEHPRQLTISDLPELIADSSASSKASSTVSTIAPFRGPLPKDIAEGMRKSASLSPPAASPRHSEQPLAKNSIDFLTT